jgi:hypothetical protein
MNINNLENENFLKAVKPSHKLKLEHDDGRKKQKNVHFIDKEMHPKRIEKIKERN